MSRDVFLVLNFCFLAFCVLAFWKVVFWSELVLSFGLVVLVQLFFLLVAVYSHHLIFDRYYLKVVRERNFLEFENLRGRSR